MNIKKIKKFTPELLLKFIYLLLTLYYQIIFFIKSKSFNLIDFRNRTSDAGMFKQVFINGEYNFFKNLNPKVIIDAGANVGFASLFFAIKFPNADIYSFEPEKTNYLQLIKNTSAYSNIHPICAGIWSKKTNLIISNIDNSSKCSFVTEESNSNNGIVAISFNDFFKQLNTTIDILKIDVEGSEFEIFSKNTDWINKVNILIIEIHEHLKVGSEKLIFSMLNNDSWTHFKKGENDVFVRKNIFNLL